MWFLILIGKIIGGIISFISVIIIGMLLFDKNKNSSTIVGIIFFLFILSISGKVYNKLNTINQQNKQQETIEQDVKEAWENKQEEPQEKQSDKNENPLFKQTEITLKDNTKKNVYNIIKAKVTAINNYDNINIDCYDNNDNIIYSTIIKSSLKSIRECSINVRSNGKVNISQDEIDKKVTNYFSQTLLNKTIYIQYIKKTMFFEDKEPFEASMWWDKPTFEILNKDSIRDSIKNEERDFIQNNFIDKQFCENGYLEYSPHILSGILCYFTKDDGYAEDNHLGIYSLINNSETQITKSNSNSNNYQDETVYITNTGNHYHTKKNCRGLSKAKNISSITLNEAKKRGFTSCDLCD